jgi:multisubunit Na+/H+ antiporter MnhF subunit
MALATPDEPEITRRALFKERDKVYPKSVKGRFRKLKWTALILLLSIYYITPWIRWDRGPDAPDQAVLIDMTGRRAYFFLAHIGFWGDGACHATKAAMRAFPRRRVLWTNWKKPR